MEKSIWWKCMCIIFAFGRNGSRYGPLSLFFYSPLFLLPITWPWHLSHVIKDRYAILLIWIHEFLGLYWPDRILVWTLLNSFLNLNCKTKEICIMIVSYFIEKYCIHNRRELTKIISEKSWYLGIPKQHEKSQITRTHGNSWDIEYEFT